MEEKITEESFLKVVEQAAAHMYLSVGDTESLSEDYVVEKELSNNVLVLEITGPDVSNASIVDFPGLMHSTSLASFGFCHYLED